MVKNAPGQITKELAKDQNFAAMVADIERMSGTERSRLLNQAQRTYKPTWAQMGRICREGRGQTDAGQKAERKIADTVVALVRQKL